VFDMSGLRNLEEFTSMTNMELRGVDKELPAVVTFSTE